MLQNLEVLFETRKHPSKIKIYADYGFFILFFRIIQNSQELPHIIHVNNCGMIIMHGIMTLL